MIRIVGFHIPPTVSKHRDLIIDRFHLTKSQQIFLQEEEEKKTEEEVRKNADPTPWNSDLSRLKTFRSYKYQSVTFEPCVYSRCLSLEDDLKQGRYKETEWERSTYTESILTDLAPGDVKQLVKTEEELSQTKNFVRLRRNPTIIFGILNASPTLTSC